MENQVQNNRLLLLFAITLLVCLILNIGFGQVYIPISDVFKSLFGLKMDNNSYQYIINNFRLPKALTAILVGICLSISGLMMQTLFRNPLAGPYVLGLSSGSSLGVAMLILGATFLPQSISSILMSNYGIILASSLGSFLVLIFIIIVSNKIKSAATILIIGMMFGSFASAIINVLAYFTTAEALQKFTFWSMGNLGNLSWEQILILLTITSIGLFLSFVSIKPLDSLLLGENYARSLGTNIRQSRLLIILATSLLSGVITAFVGPIAFVGLAVPHIAKIIFKTSKHKILFMATILIGSTLMLLCDLIAQMPGFEIILPINAVTSIIGAPIVIYLIINYKKIGF